MILSFKNKFIFLKTTKTAGTSVEVYLSQFLHDGDVATKLKDEDEKLRENLTNITPTNQINYKGNSIQFRNHMSGNALKNRMKKLDRKEEFKAFYKFAFERNPFCRIVSSYRWSKPKQSFNEWLTKEKLERMRVTTLGIYVNKKTGKKIVDKIYKFEDLDGFRKDFLERFNLKEKISFPKTKITSQSSNLSEKNRKKEYREFFNDRKRQLVEKVFSDVLKEFEYEF